MSRRYAIQFERPAAGQAEAVRKAGLRRRPASKVSLFDRMAVPCIDGEDSAAVKPLDSLEPPSAPSGASILSAAPQSAHPRAFQQHETNRCAP